MDFSYIFLFIALATLWLNYCNYKTSKHRGEILDEIFRNAFWDSLYGEKLDKFEGVSYNTHLFRLVRGNWKWRSWYETK
jgi:hypothetical protein